jgi:hypothetical protein
MAEQQGTPLSPDVAMTLAAFAAIGAAPLPSGETLAAQHARIKLGLDPQLLASPLTKSWKLAWLALSPDNANMAYIVRNNNATDFAVVLRGTQANLPDILEDLGVGAIVPFAAGGSKDPVSVSKGAMEAFTQVVTMAAPDTGATMVQQLEFLLRGVAQPTVYVIGHSLGGCLATMVGPYLQAHQWIANKPQVGVVTFAAPTAGLADFATYFQSLPWCQNERYVNSYDLIPLAWDQLDDFGKKNWYPNPGPVATAEVKELVGVIAGSRGYNVYAQPGAPILLNTKYELHNDVLTRQSTGDFMGQVGYQHANSTYLKALNAPVPPMDPPIVASVSPSFGAVGTPVTITGTGLDQPGVQVDFGAVAIEKFDVNEQGTEISVDAPEGSGVVAVTVSSPLGTSPAVPSGRFAYGGPEPVEVTAISPISGIEGTPVTIKGVGFADSPAVYFGNVPANSVRFVGPNEITVTAPSHDATKQPKIVNVTVVVNGYSSPTGHDDQFAYPL